MEILVILAVFAAFATLMWAPIFFWLKTEKKSTSCGSVDTTVIKWVIDNDGERVTLTRRCNACSFQYEYKAMRNRHTL